MRVCVYPLQNINDPTTVEVFACLQAIFFTEEMGFRDVDIEGDLLVVTKKLRSTEMDRSIICNIIQEIKERAQRFRSILFQYVPHSRNEVTHALADWGRDLEAPSYWMEEVLVNVELVVQKDLERIEIL